MGFIRHEEIPPPIQEAQYSPDKSGEVGPMFFSCLPFSLNVSLLEAGKPGLGCSADSFPSWKMEGTQPSQPHGREWGPSLWLSERPNWTYGFCGSVRWVWEPVLAPHDWVPIWGLIFLIYKMDVVGPQQHQSVMIGVGR